MLKKIGVDGFIASLIAAIILAYLFPNIGTETAFLPVSHITYYGISLVFFLYGLKFNFSEFAQGLSNWKMHIIIQTTTFILFPTLILLCKPFITDQTIWLSMFYLSALPSTVSSAVIMVSLANGNIPASIFNASISSLAGILITPAWMSFFLSAHIQDFNAYDIYGKLVFQIILPITIGMILHPLIGKYALKKKPTLKYFEQGIVVFVIYTSFCRSFAENIFSDYSGLTIATITIGIIILFLTVFFLLKIISAHLLMNRKDTITVQFCGSQKSLLHGVAIASILFADSTITGFILIPIMLYHSIQLIITGYIAHKMAKK
ncbi:MAG: bile acid:sodium symporter [Bacteroidales bacterium]|nr:bile acid:sodium symporter [Bacteroidales bacterium]